MWPFVSPKAQTGGGKRGEREEALSRYSRLHIAEDDQYLRATASGIVSRIERGEWTAVRVLQAYMSQAVRAHAKTNCLTEIMFEPALLRATQLDEEFSRSRKLVGPLHGVPLSLKDQFDVVGYDSTMGFTQLANRPATANARVVDLLVAAGAVPFVKTNLPQAFLTIECSNPLWGRTTNPYSDKYTSGGSSGGEAALLAMSGSALGMGSDIGGSLRIPASNCGIFSLKPGKDRMPEDGVGSCFGGNTNVRLVLGPMARSVEDLILASRVLLGKTDMIGAVPPVPYREVKLPEKLKFGFYTDDNFVKASPANARAVRETVHALRQKGHECIELDWTFGSEPARIFGGLIGADGYKTMFDFLGSDPLEHSMQSLYYLPVLPRLVKHGMAGMMTHVLGDPHFGALLMQGRAKSAYEVFSLVRDQAALTERLQTEIWNPHGLDGILAPVQALPCVPHDMGRDLGSLGNATIQYNIADSPVGVVPVTRVDPTLDALPDGYWSSTGPHSPIVSSACQKVYLVDEMAGLPVGIQVVGRKWEEEKVLCMMQVIDNALGERGFGPTAMLGM